MFPASSLVEMLAPSSLSFSRITNYLILPMVGLVQPVSLNSNSLRSNQPSYHARYTVMSFIAEWQMVPKNWCYEMAEDYIITLVYLLLE